MATIVITIPDAVLGRVIDGMAAAHGYQEVLEDDTPNPETKAQFARRIVRQFIKDSVKSAEVTAASRTAADSAGSSADADIILS
jgi:uncharacterized protein (DUF1800 family)